MIRNNVDEIIKLLRGLKKIDSALGETQDRILLDRAIETIERVIDIFKSEESGSIYIELFQGKIYDLNYTFLTHDPKLFPIPSNFNKTHSSLESKRNLISTKIRAIDFLITFFSQTNFLKQNIVAVGANGSGKTKLSNKFRELISRTGIVISAQKIMVIPTFTSISNPEQTLTRLTKHQNENDPYRTTYESSNSIASSGEFIRGAMQFEVLLDNLLAERSVELNDFFNNNAVNNFVTEKPTPKLDKCIEIWNLLIDNKILECSDGINLVVHSKKTEDSYPAYSMSDGEKVILYLVSHVLQAPESGFIVVDEPETYLHKSIVNSLWNKLEFERKDCLFIYLTHDLDFAVQRTGAEKIWIKSFQYPDQWDMFKIGNNEIPEELLLELLGSRKDILFCESKSGKYDEKVYNILLPQYTIVPVDGCFSVINYTKSFNKLQNVNIKARGIIDSDYHGKDRLEALSSDSIYGIHLPEIENMFFDEEFLQIMHHYFMSPDPTFVNNIKSEVIDKFYNDIELQISLFLSNKINNYFKDSHVRKGKTKNEVKSNFEKFYHQIDINEWYNKRKTDLIKLYKEKNYSEILAKFNHKGLISTGNKFFKVSDFQDKAIKVLQEKFEAREVLKKYIPDVLK